MYRICSSLKCNDRYTCRLLGGTLFCLATGLELNICSFLFMYLVQKKKKICFNNLYSK